MNTSGRYRRRHRVCATKVTLPFGQRRQGRARSAQRAAAIRVDGARAAAAAIGRVAVLVEFALEERRAQANRRDDLVIEERAAVLECVLQQFGDEYRSRPRMMSPSAA
jgi:hypothetical protein